MLLHIATVHTPSYTLNVHSDKRIIQQYLRNIVKPNKNYECRCNIMLCACFTLCGQIQDQYKVGIGKILALNHTHN